MGWVKVTGCAGTGVKAEVRQGPASTPPKGNVANNSQPRVGVGLANSRHRRRAKIAANPERGIRHGELTRCVLWGLTARVSSL